MSIIGRPHKFRRLSQFEPRSVLFQPDGLDSGDFSKIFLTAEELEALRLRYYGDENGIRKNQTESATEMGISQTTYSRIVNKAFEKITKALIEGNAIALQPNGGPRARRGRKGGKMMPTPGWKTSVGPQNVIFNGHGCLNCGFEWQNAEKEESASKGKVNCPECQTGKTYRLIKKGPLL